MRIVIAAVLLVSQSLLVGCGTTANVTTEHRLAQGEQVKLQISTPPAASEEGATIFRERLRSQLLGKGLLANPNDASSKTLEVTVDNYTMRHGASRAMLGIMAGSDSIQSTVRVRDQAGKALSEFTVESKNSTAWGTSRGLIEEHADEIVATVTGTKR